MVETYQITTQGLMDGFSRDQVAEMLAILFKRSTEEIQSMLSEQGFVVKKDIDFPAAIKFKVALEQRGCRCAIEEYSKADQLHSQFPDTVLDPFDSSPPTMPVQSGVQTGGLALLEIEEDPVPPEEACKPVVATVVTPVKVPAPIKIPSATNEIGITVDGNPFLVQTPQDFCCNCGAKTNISIVETQFVKHLVFSTRFEKEKYIELDLPYCPTCADSVGKYPMSSALKWLIGFCIWFLGLMYLTTHVNMAQKNILLRILLVALPLIPGIVVFRWIGKARSPKTSKYTPVIIREFSRNPNSTRQEGRAMLLVSMIAAVAEWLFKKFSQHDPDVIKKLTIKFSNPDYAKLFKKANKGLIQSGHMKIR